MVLKKLSEELCNDADVMNCRRKENLKTEIIDLINT